MLLQSETQALDDRISEPYGVRAPGGISLSGCHPNRVQASWLASIWNTVGRSDWDYLRLHWTSAQLYGLSAKHVDQYWKPADASEFSGHVATAWRHFLRPVGCRSGALQWEDRH